MQEPSFSKHYDSDYFVWQRAMGDLSGWIHSRVFQGSIKATDTVVDFGCGGGYLLHYLNCKAKVGIEPNVAAADSIKGFGIRHFTSASDAVRQLGEGFADVVVSSNVLEHSMDPLRELQMLKAVLRPGGTIHFVVPCESLSMKYSADDINQHLFSWSPGNIGNLFALAGFEVIASKPRLYMYRTSFRALMPFGARVFDFICKIWGRLDRRWSESEVIARRPLH